MVEALGPSPDRVGSGLSDRPLDAGRYDGHSDNPAEVAGVLHALVPRGARVLDVGCGTGSVALIANRGKGNVYVGLEPDLDRVNIARSRGLDVSVGFLDDQFISEHGRFDVVMASDVIEHVSDPAAFLEQTKRALEPAGLIIISTPNVAHWSVRLALLFGRFNYEPTGIMDATHLRWFTQATIRGLAEACGLEIVDYRFSAGSDLSVYHRGLWRALPYRIRVPLIRRLSQIVPRLFGVQHVVSFRSKGLIVKGFGLA